MKISAKLRKKASKIVQNILKPTYFSEIPLQTLMNELKEIGIVVLQEDNTEWSGFLLGSSSRASFNIGNMSSSKTESHGEVYELIENSMLIISWYTQKNKIGNQIEVIGYTS